jgi:hypothetical protein
MKTIFDNKLRIINYERFRKVFGPQMKDPLGFTLVIINGKVQI